MEVYILCRIQLEGQDTSILLLLHMIFNMIKILYSLHIRIRTPIQI